MSIAPVRFKQIEQMLKILISGLIILFLFSTRTSFAQDTKKLEKVKAFFNEETHSPTKALIYSAILPGWGQAYNRKYWKIPLVYAGFGGIGYFVKTQHDLYQLYKNDFFLLKEDPTAQTATGFGQADLRVLINNTRRTRDLSIAGMLAWYGLNLIDANVDGHFFNYDVDEDLTLNVQPWFGHQNQSNRGLGLSLNINLK